MIAIETKTISKFIEGNTLSAEAFAKEHNISNKKASSILKFVAENPQTQFIVLN